MFAFQQGLWQDSRKNRGYIAMNKEGLSESLEDYLETILDLERTNKVARAKDIAERLGVLRGSVTGALKTLAERGLINYTPYSFITLTRKGASIAKEIARRHEVIKDFLQSVLFLDAEKAELNACRMEHAMDKGTVDRLVKFIEYIHTCPRAGQDWIHSFVNFYSKTEHKQENCMSCLTDCINRHRESKSSSE